MGHPFSEIDSRPARVSADFNNSCGKQEDLLLKLSAALTLCTLIILLRIDRLFVL